MMKIVRESIFDKSEKELSPEVWDGDKVRSDAKAEMISRFEKWAKRLKLGVKPTRFILVGSMTGKNYNDETDLDISVEVDIPEERHDRLRKLLPNGDPLPGTKHPINYYLLLPGQYNDNRFHGIYDLLADEWVKRPDDKNVNPKEHFKNGLYQAISWARKIASDIDELRRDMIELRILQHFLKDKEIKSDDEELEAQIESKKLEIKADYDVLKMNKHMLSKFRSEAFIDNKPFDSKTVPSETVRDADFSLNNLVFKILEKFNYIDAMNDATEEAKKMLPDILGQEAPN